MIEKITGSGTRNSLNLYFDLPQMRALLDIKAHQSAKAVEDMEPARKYQMRDIGVLYERARAEAEAGMFDAAAADYRLILANPGLDPIWTDNTLSHFRLAHVLALKNDTVERCFLTKGRLIGRCELDRHSPTGRAGIPLTATR